MYRKLADKILYGEHQVRKDAIMKLEKLKTEKAINLLIKLFLHHNEEGMDGIDCARDKAMMPLLRLWKLAPEKIIPIIPRMFPFFFHYELEEEAKQIFNEMDKKTLLVIFEKGLNDYDWVVRAGALAVVNKRILAEAIPLLIKAYKLEVVSNVQGEIIHVLMPNLNEEIAEVIFDLAKNYEIETDTFYDFEIYDLTEEMALKVLPILLRKWNEEKDDTIRDYIRYTTEFVIDFYEDKISKILSEVEIKQIQEMRINLKED